MPNYDHWSVLARQTWCRRESVRTVTVQGGQDGFDELFEGGLLVAANGFAVDQQLDLSDGGAVLSIYAANFWTRHSE